MGNHLNNYHIIDQWHNHSFKIHLYMRSYAHGNGNKQAQPWSNIWNNVQYSNDKPHYKRLLKVNPGDSHTNINQYHYACALNNDPDEIPCQKAFYRIERPAYIFSVLFGHPHQNRFKKQVLVFQKEECNESDGENRNKDVPQYSEK